MKIPEQVMRRDGTGRELCGLRTPRLGHEKGAGAHRCLHRPGSQHPPRPDSLRSPEPLGASSAWLPWLRSSAQDKHQLALSCLRR